MRIGALYFVATLLTILIFTAGMSIPLGKILMSVEQCAKCCKENK